DVKTLDPGREFEFGAAFVDLNCYDTLVAHKSPKELNTFVPVLATSWTVSPDGKEYTFKLRPNVKHASGNPFTAEDVKFSLTRLKTLKGNPGWMMDPLKEVVVVDPMTGKTILNESFADWLPVLSGPNSAIMDAKLAKEHGASDSPTADKDDQAEEWLNQNPAGVGPPPGAGQEGGPPGHPTRRRARGDHQAHQRPRGHRPRRLPDRGPRPRDPGRRRPAESEVRPQAGQGAPGQGWSAERVQVPPEV